MRGVRPLVLLLLGQLAGCGGTPCGDTRCKEGEVCTTHERFGETCLFPWDGGCPPGTVHGRFDDSCPRGSLNCDPPTGPPTCEPPDCITDEDCRPRVSRPCEEVQSWACVRGACTGTAVVSLCDLGGGGPSDM